MTGILSSKRIANRFSAQIIFGEQTEFRGVAKQIFQVVKELEIAERLDQPDFEDMKKIVPLQAADIVAYELYKEAERNRYRPQDAPRFGYKEFEKMALRVKQKYVFFFNQRHVMLQLVSDLKRRRLVRGIDE